MKTAFRSLRRKLKKLGKAAVTSPARVLGRPLSMKDQIRTASVSRVHYAYGIYYAALQAKALGMPKISTVEFGVAGGNGLVRMEEIAAQVEREVGIGIEVYGFDLGTGMAEPKDYRDMPYVWQKGFFAMDVEKLQARLSRAKLILGDVAETVPPFIEERQPAPIGFIAFDLDYYSSTMDAFTLLAQPTRYFLPRVFCYFDDVVGNDWELHSEFTGELLAIREFNEQNEARKIAKIHGLRYKQKVDGRWIEKMHVLHLFDHPEYCTHVNPQKDWQMPLRG